MSRSIVAMTLIVLASCGGEDPDAPGSAGGTPGRPEGRVSALNPTALPAKAHGIELGPFQSRALSPAEEAAVGVTRQPGVDKVVCIAGKATFELLEYYYTAPTAFGGAAPKSIRTWPETAGPVEIPRDDGHCGVVDPLPETKWVGRDGSASMRKLEWTPVGLPPEGRWPDDARWAVLSSPGPIPATLVAKARVDLWRVEDPKFVPFLLEAFYVLNVTRDDGDRARWTETLLRLLQGAHGPAIDEAVQKVRKDPNRYPAPRLGGFATCYARIGRQGDAVALLPSKDDRNQAEFFWGMSPELAATVVERASDRLTDHSLDTAVSRIVHGDVPIPDPIVDLLLARVATRSRPELVANLAAILQERFAALDEARAGRILDAVFAAEAERPRYDGGGPAPGLFQVLSADANPAGWRLLASRWERWSDDQRNLAVANVAGSRSATPEERLPLLRAAVRTPGGSRDRAIAWLLSEGRDLPDDLRGEVVALASPSMLARAGRGWWPLVLERWDSFEESDRKDLSRRALADPEASDAEKLPFVRRGLAGDAKAARSILDHLRSHPDQPADVRQLALEQIATPDVKGSPFLSGLDPGWWGEVAGVFARLEPTEQLAFLNGISRAGERAKEAAPILELAFGASPEVAANALVRAVELGAALPAATRKKALERAGRPDVPAHVAAQVKAALGK